MNETEETIRRMMILQRTIADIRKRREKKRGQVMNEDLVRRMENVARVFALVMAANARVEGMKAENANRLSNGCSVAYGDIDFSAVESEIANLVNVLG